MSNALDGTPTKSFDNKNSSPFPRSTVNFQFLGGKVILKFTATIWIGEGE
jgi:hypothetical protein